MNGCNNPHIKFILIVFMQPSAISLQFTYCLSCLFIVAVLLAFSLHI